METTSEAQSVFNHRVKLADGTMEALEKYRGSVVLVVNVASRCAFTPQYEQLQSLYAKYRDQGFVILGFPCNQFGAQEPGSDASIHEFCSTRYGVDFPVYSKINVNGSDAIPLFRFLKHQAPGILGTEAIKWNFTKFLVDRTGTRVLRFAPSVSPESLAQSIETFLAS